VRGGSEGAELAVLHRELFHNLMDASPSTRRMMDEISLARLRENKSQVAEAA
jgi:hypothetical protein